MREGAPEARTGAQDGAELMDEVWGALPARLRVAMAVFEPERPAEAALRHEAAAVQRAGRRPNASSLLPRGARS